MPILDQDLDYQVHLNALKKHGYLNEGGEGNIYWHHQAQQIHCTVVIQAIGDLQSEIVATGQKLGSGKAYDQLVHGAAYRCRIIWSALRVIRELIPPDRTEPLQHDSVFEVARALNDIYIHLRGCLDNFAWALIELSGSQSLMNLRPVEVSLFSKKLLNCPSMAKYKTDILQFEDWNREIKQLRDPVAHRIPLSVPPTVLSDDDKLLYQEAMLQWNSACAHWSKLCAIGALRVEIEQANLETELSHDRIQKIGRFVPIIVHDPSENGVPVYPTAPQDIGVAIILIRRLCVNMVT